MEDDFLSLFLMIFIPGLLLVWLAGMAWATRYLFKSRREFMHVARERSRDTGAPVFFLAIGVFVIAVVVWPILVAAHYQVYNRLPLANG